ncbi:hypothetical protein HPB50_004753 [Hyalomma asiaticum]|uniref:Uncharacterized protein n=1 Tax=Hyalomma asiaticum TaxID=266040 RepID=A0ACB7S472_HYAAI|nr:hypothetical protein HPB50_004753 [Hyalomma asiaticum]
MTPWHVVGWRHPADDHDDANRRSVAPRILTRPHDHNNEDLSKIRIPLEDASAVKAKCRELIREMVEVGLYKEASTKVICIEFSSASTHGTPKGSLKYTLVLPVPQKFAFEQTMLRSFRDVFDNPSLEYFGGSTGRITKGAKEATQTARQLPAAKVVQFGPLSCTPVEQVPITFLRFLRRCCKDDCT